MHYTYTSHKRPQGGQRDIAVISAFEVPIFPIARKVSPPNVYSI